MPACRSSGLMTADTLVYTGQVRVASIFVQETAGSAATIIVYDNTAASGDIIAKVILASGARQDIDLHGVLCTKGIYFKESAGAVNCFINYY